MPETIPAITIACDESGSEGENVRAAAHRIFCHGSTDLSLSEAEQVIANTRGALNVQGAELKAGTLLKPKAGFYTRELFGPHGPLRGRSQMYLVDKQFFLVGKVIDLLVVELAYDTGVDLYIGRRARELAYDLHLNGRRALGTASWDILLQKFNSLMRLKQRGATPKTTIDEFYDTLDALKYRARRRTVEEVLLLLARTRPQAEQFQALLTDPATESTTLDPLLAALPQTIRTWYEKTGRPIEVVHDEQVALDEKTRGDMVRVLRTPPPDFERHVNRVDVRSIILIDSKADARVQVADLVAGIGRKLATQALGGEQPLIDPVPYVAGSSLWADDRSWLTLTAKKSVRD